MKEYMTVDYEDRYHTLMKVYRDEVVDHQTTKDDKMRLLRYYMIESAQLHSELDEARELIDTLLQPVDKSKREY